LAFVVFCFPHLPEPALFFHFIIHRIHAFFKKSLIFFKKIWNFLFTNPEFRV